MTGKPLAAVLCLLCLTLLSCALLTNAQQTLAKHAPTVVAEPTARPPTTTPRPTWERVQGISEAVLRLEDLPPGFEEVPFEGFIPSDLESLVGEGEEEVEGQFIFRAPAYGEILYGYIILLATAPERAWFDVSLRQDGVPLREWCEQDERIEVLEEAELTELEDIGETRGGERVVVLMDNVRIRWEMVMFRRERLEGVIFVLYPAEGESILSAGDAARRLDRRIIEVLGLE